MRLQKYMAQCGAASRRSAEQMMLSGRVTVNGETVTHLGTCVEAGDVVCLDGKTLLPEDKRIYIMLNKPQKVVSTVSDPEGRVTVLDLVKLPYRLYPVGRLDYNTTGLILLVNDGDAAYRLTHPKFEIEKEYIAVIAGTIDKTQVLKLESGVNVDGQLTSECKARIVSTSEHTTTLSVIIREGRNRQVRKMFEALGKEVLDLMRIRHGEIVLSGVKSGEWRYLNDTEIKYLDSLK